MQQPVRQLVHFFFISNNCPSFHLWLKENLVKHQKVWNYYETDCLQNFIFLFMLLLTSKFVKNRYIYPKIFFIFLKRVLKQNSINNKFLPQWKDRESSFCFLFNCYLAAPRPTSGHYWGDSLTHPMLINAVFFTFSTRRSPGAS